LWVQVRDTGAPAHTEVTRMPHAMEERFWPTGDRQAAGRHALDEDAVLAPIFHALTRGGWRRRQHERAGDPVEEFRRDPLTAPVPVQAIEAQIPAPVPADRPGGRRRRGAHAH
jgi:hypothetical protein